jgi:hypothetical protein
MIKASIFGVPSMRRSSAYGVQQSESRGPERKLLAASPYGCAGSAPDMASEYNYMGVVGNLSGMTPTGWCAASFVAMKANLGSQPITDSVLLDLVDTPLLVRSALATSAWARGMQSQAQQQELKKNEQTAVPKL